MLNNKRAELFVESGPSFFIQEVLKRVIIEEPALRKTRASEKTEET